MDTWPPDPEHAAVVAAGWLAKRHRGSEVTVAEPAVAVGDGFDTAIVATRFAGAALAGAWTGPVVLRVHPTAARLALAKREARVQGFVADAGFPAPRVLGVIPPRSNALGLPIQIMERVPGTTLLKAATSRPWRATRLFRELGALHARLHALPTDGWVGEPDERSMAERRLHLVRDVVDQHPEIGGPGLARALERAQTLVPRLAVDDPVICHGDYHPLNVMAHGRDLEVIDWTDAALADAQGDVSRLLGLLTMAPVGAPTSMQRRVLRRALPPLARAYRVGYLTAGTIDEARIALWRPVHLAHDWARAELTLHQSGEERVSHDVVAWIVEQFSRAMAAVE